jgi:hypothetical protein
MEKEQKTDFFDTINIDYVESKMKIQISKNSYRVIVERTII